MQQPYISCNEIERLYGIKPSTVRNFRQKHNIVVNSKFQPDINEFVAKAVEFNNNIGEMAKYYSKDRDTITKYADSIGYNIHKRQLTKEEEQEIVNKYYDYSQSALAEMFGVTKSCIGGVWHRYGLSGKGSRVYYIHNENAFKNLDTETAYMLGFIGADGCVYKHPGDDTRQQILSISILKQDAYVLEMFKEKLKTNKPIQYTDVMASLQISSDIIVDDLKNLGLSYRKTYENTIANVPDALMPHLIRGYVDGDGSISYSPGKIVRVCISGYSYNMLKIQKYLEQNNIFSTFVVDNREYTECNAGDFGSLTFSNKTSMYSFLKLIYDNCGNYYMPRKKIVADEFINYIESSENVRDKQIVIYYNYAVCKKAS